MNPHSLGETFSPQRLPFRNSGIDEGVIPAQQGWEKCKIQAPNKIYEVIERDPLPERTKIISELADRILELEKIFRDIAESL